MTKKTSKEKEKPVKKEKNLIEIASKGKSKNKDKHENNHKTEFYAENE